MTVPHRTIEDLIEIYDALAADMAELEWNSPKFFGLSETLNTLYRNIHYAMESKLSPRKLCVIWVDLAENKLVYKSEAFEVDGIFYARRMAESVECARTIISFEDPFTGESTSDCMYRANNQHFSAMREHEQWRDLTWEPELRF